MERRDRLERRLSSAQDLKTVVGTMKSMAAVNINRFGRAAEAVNRYVDNLTLAMSALVEYRRVEPERAAGAGTRAVGCIVFGSAHGLCGSFNEQIAAFADGELDKLDVPPSRLRVLAMGNRVAGTLHDADRNIDAMYRIAGSTEARGELVREVLETLDRWQAADGVERVFVVFNRPETKERFSAVRRRILPLDPAYIASPESAGWSPRSIPIVQGDADELFHRISRLYFRALLEQAFLDSLASESMSRLQAMEAAEKNIDDRLEDLERRMNRVRQQSITEELLDIVSGFEALSGT